MINFNPFWMFVPLNLFPMGRGPGRNNTQNMSQSSSDFWVGANTAVPEHSDISLHSEPNPPGCCSCYAEPGPMGPRGEPGPPGCPGERGEPGYPQNRIFSTFSGREPVISENARLSLETDIPDNSGSISLSGDSSVMLLPGYYAVYCHVSATLKKHGFMKLTPSFNGSEQTKYTMYAETAKRTETIEMSRYFIVEIPGESPLYFTWDASAWDSRPSVNLCIEKFCRQ